MLRNRCLVTLVCAVLIPLVVAGPSFAWCPIAHYEICKEAVGTLSGEFAQVPLYAQLPDYRPSWRMSQATPGGGDAFDIDYHFCWSHGVLDAGETAGVAIKPVYPMPADGRYPGPIMWTLVHEKLSQLSSAVITEMELTALGFRAHNAADQAVHFGYFEGAVPGQTSGDAALAWWIDHAKKEQWADYMIYIRNHFGGDTAAAFAPSPHPDIPGLLRIVPEYASGVPAAPPTEGMTRIMRLAQMAYRKNRRATELSETTGDLRIQSTAEIRTSIITNINGAVTAGDIQIARDEFRMLEDLASNPERNWTLTELESKYQESITNVRSWLQNME